MITRIKKMIHSFFGMYGLKIVPKSTGIATDMEDGFRTIYNYCRDYTMISTGGMYSLYKAVEYVHEAGIEGDIVECGVWKGGSSMISAHTLISKGDTSRKLYLYDTFEGMPEPDTDDIKIRTGVSGKEIWKQMQPVGGWVNAGLNEVQKNMFSTAYPKENIVFVKGMVEDTIPKKIPKKISILRLDTDFFKSTHHELQHLFPLLTNGGVLIIDDYGSWSGSKKATDQYFKENNIHMLLQRVDTSRVGIKLSQ